MLMFMPQINKKYSFNTKSLNRSRFKTTQSQSKPKPNRRYTQASLPHNPKVSLPLKSMKPTQVSSNQLQTEQTDLSYLEELQKIKNERIKEIYNPKGKSISLARIQKKKQAEFKESLNHKPYLDFDGREENKMGKALVEKVNMKKNIKLGNIERKEELPKYTKFYDTYSNQYLKRGKEKEEKEIVEITNNYKPYLQIMKDFQFDSFSMKKYIEGVYYGEFDSDKKKEGRGVIFYKNGKLYEGQFSNDLKNGKGYQLNPDGTFYDGQFKNGMKNGKGKYQWQNGEIYDGQWKNNLKHGSGLWQGEGSSYIGQWNHGVISGFGVLTNEKGERYEGQFVNFCKQGKGTFRFQNGQIYVGIFYKNKPNGEGEYYWKNGDIYKGDFVNGLRHGDGSMKYSTGIYYNGQFRNDKKCGLGEEVFEDGITYIGNFENDFRHGYGKIICDGNIFYDGYWLNNMAVDINETPVIEEDERDLLNSAFEVKKSKKNMGKEKVKKVIKNEIKLKNSKVQRSDSINVLERLYNPSKKECKCYKRH